MGPTPKSTIDYIPLHATHVPASFGYPPTTTSHVSRSQIGSTFFPAARTAATAAAAAVPMVARDAAGRFLAVLRRPSHHPPAPPFELDESDVVWSPSSPADDQPPSPASPPADSPFRPDRPGISAALSDDRRPLVRRKTSLDPSTSAASAARAIPPVPVLRSGCSGSASSGESAPARFPQSAPVNVPVWPKVRSSERLGIWDEDEDEDKNGDGEEEVMLPPHEIVARSHKGTTFSVFEGVGRTLKGRDLRRVRNAVFQKTGFLEQ